MSADQTVLSGETRNEPFLLNHASERDRKRAEGAVHSDSSVSRDCGHRPARDATSHVTLELQHCSRDCGHQAVKEHVHSDPSYSLQQRLWSQGSKGALPVTLLQPAAETVVTDS